MSLVDTLKTKKDFRDYRKVSSFVEAMAEEIPLDGVVYDLCCGNGMLGFYILERNPCAFVYFVDQKRTNRFNELSEAVGAKGVDDAEVSCAKSLEDGVEKDYQFLERDLYHLDELSEGVLLSIHACGSLTERILEMGVENDLPSAVMTCCHNKELRLLYQDSLPSHYLFNQGLKDYVDLARVKKMKKLGKEARMKELSLGRKKEKIIFFV